LLKPYIDFNTQKRKEAKNDFEKDFRKLMNNSVYGKTMENVRKRQNIILISDKDKFVKQVSKPTYISSKIFNKDLVAVHKLKQTITLNKPIYVGMCILDLSNTLMYDFHYKHIKKKYGSKTKLFFTDTDSLCYEIETEDVYKDMGESKDLFDFSNYDKNSPFYDPINQKILGKMKDETGGVPITEFCALKPKMYAFAREDDKEHKTAKGVRKNIIRNQLKLENYKDALFNEKQRHDEMKSIRSDHQKLGSYKINKVSLSADDDKRFYSDDGISSYPYG